MEEDPLAALAAAVDECMPSVVVAENDGALLACELIHQCWFSLELEDAHLAYCHLHTAEIADKALADADYAEFAAVAEALVTGLREWLYLHQVPQLRVTLWSSMAEKYFKVVVPAAAHHRKG